MWISSSLENPRLDCLNDENALQKALIDEGNSEKRVVSVFAGFAEVLETGMILHLLHRDRTQLLRHQARQTFM